MAGLSYQELLAKGGKPATTSTTGQPMATTQGKTLAELQNIPPVNDVFAKSAETYKPWVEARPTTAALPSPVKQIVAGGTVAANLIPSAWGMVKGIGSLVAHPIQSAETAAGIISGGIKSLPSPTLTPETRAAADKFDQSLSPEKTQMEIARDKANKELFKGLVDGLKERYGGIEELEATAQNDPFGFATDILAVITAGGTLATKAGLLKKGATGAAISETAALATKEVPAIAQDIAAATGKAGEAIMETRPGMAVSETLKGISSKNTPQEAIGQVLQGKETDIAAGQRALAAIENTPEIKTFKVLDDEISKKISTVAKEVDTELMKDPTLSRMDELATTKKTSAGTPVTTNYVQQAMDHLEEVYQKTGDVVKAEEVNALKQRATSTGLSKLELNNLAREYGQNFKSKAFGKTGEPLTSVNAKLFENVRSGLKDVVRQNLPGDIVKGKDKLISDLYRTQKLIRKNAIAANKLSQKAEKMGLGKKAFRGFIKALDIATLGGTRAVRELLIQSNIGRKTMNSLDVENALNKNLRIIEKANKRLTKENIVGGKFVPKSKTGKYIQAGKLRPGMTTKEIKLPTEKVFDVKAGTKAKIDDFSPSENVPLEKSNRAYQKIVEAVEGGRAPRKPIDYIELSDGRKIIVDGNSTYTALKNAGIKDIVVKKIEHPKDRFKIVIDKQRVTKNQSKVVRSMTNKDKTDFISAKAAHAEVFEEFKAGINSVNETIAKAGVKLEGETRAVRKGDARFIEKVIEEEGGNFAAVSDGNRAMFVPTNIADFKTIIDTLGKRFNVVKLDNRLTDPSAKIFDGYRDVKMNVELSNGVRAEIQIVTPKMAKAKDMVHKLYEDSRVLKGKPSLTAAEQAQLEKLVNGQIEAYSPVWEKDIAGKDMEELFNIQNIKKEAFHKDNASLRSLFPKSKIDQEVFKDVTKQVDEITQRIFQSRGAGEIPKVVKNTSEAVTKTSSTIAKSIKENPVIYPTKAGTPLKSNIEYGVTFDPENLCEKGKPFALAVRKLRENIPGGTANAAVRTAAGRIMMKRANLEGLPAPCVQCYKAEPQITGNSAPKIEQGLSVYTPGEVFKPKNADIIKNKDNILRMYGTGDFTASHIPGIIDMLKDVSKMDAGVGAYTKNLNFLEIFGDTGIKFNISSGLTKEIGIPVDVAAEYAKRYPNAGVVYVGINKADVLKALRDPKVDRVIPAHLGGGTPREMLENITQQNWDNFVRTQSEKVTVGKKVLNLQSAEVPKYVDSSKLAEAKKIIKDATYDGDGKKYLKAVKEAEGVLGFKITPKFEEFSTEPNYWKLIGSGNAEYGKSFSPVKIDVTKVNTKKAAEYFKFRETAKDVVSNGYQKLIDELTYTANNFPEKILSEAKKITLNLK